MIRYEIRERAPALGDWRTVAWFNTIGEARDYWSTTPFDGIEAKLVKIITDEQIEHYHSPEEM